MGIPQVSISSWIMITNYLKTCKLIAIRKLNSLIILPFLTRKSINININGAYDIVDKYTAKFDQIRDNYHQALAMNRDLIRNESDLNILAKFCQRYNSEMAELENIQESERLGLVQVKQLTFREEILPVCQDLLTVLDETLPRYSI